MHNYTGKSEIEQQLKEGNLGEKVAYFAISGIVEANSGYNHHTKSGKLCIDKNFSENSRSLFKVLRGSQVNNS